MTLVYLLAWLTPFALGASIVALFDGRPRAFADWMRVLGCGRRSHEIAVILIDVIAVKCRRAFPRHS